MNEINILNCFAGCGWLGYCTCAQVKEGIRAHAKDGKVVSFHDVEKALFSVLKW